MSRSFYVYPWSYLAIITEYIFYRNTKYKKNMPRSMLYMMDRLIRMGMYKSRSELIRDAIRRLILFYMRQRDLPETETNPNVEVIDIE